MERKKAKKHVLVVSSYDASYVVRDIISIQKYFPTRVIIGNSRNKNIVQILLLIFQILRGVIWADVSYIWFADFRALITIYFSRLFHKKTILVVGGYEAAYEPEISYGGTIDSKLKRRISWIVHHADVVISVSEASRKELIEHYDYDQSHLIYNGVTTESFVRDHEIPKEDIAITVGAVNASNLKRKGIETFVKAASFLPAIPFYVIGKYDNDTYTYLKKIASENVVFTNFVTEEELLQYYQRAKVYVQVSCHEAFGVSLAEAMLCECVPVVTDRAALPEVVDDTGFYVPFDDPEKTANAIREALKSSNGSNARAHILDNFSMKRREGDLLEIIRQTL